MICDERTRASRTLIKTYKVIDLQHTSLFGQILDSKFKKLQTRFGDAAKAIEDYYPQLTRGTGMPATTSLPS